MLDVLDTAGPRSLREQAFEKQPTIRCSTLLARSLFGMETSVALTNSPPIFRDDYTQRSEKIARLGALRDGYHQAEGCQELVQR